jgi:hypothetical protein
LASFDQTNNLKGSFAYLQGSIIDQRIQSLMGSLAHHQIPIQEFMQEEYDSKDEGLPVVEDDHE